MPAQNIGEIATVINGQLSGLTDLISGFAYLGGVGIGIMGALKFKMHAEDPMRVPLAVPITHMIVAMSLLALPDFLGVSLVAIGPLEASAASKGVSVAEIPRAPVEIVPLEEDGWNADSSMDLGGSSGGW